MDWKDVGKVVAGAAPVLGTALGGPVGGAIGAIVASLFGVDATPDQVAAAIKADPEAFLKLRQLELDHARELRTAVLQAETARLAEVNATIRAEVASSDPYVRRMRPTWGYVMAASWTALVYAIVHTIIAEPGQAPAVISAVVGLTPLFGIGLAVLGIYVRDRTREKALAAGAQPDFGLLGAVARRIAGQTR